MIVGSQQVFIILKFPITQAAKDLLLNGSADSLHVSLSLSHPNLTANVALILLA